MAEDFDEPIVLKVYMHCQGCENQVLRCLRGFEGVEEIEINGKSNRVTVKGKGADPIRVTERVKKKTGKFVDLISPLPKQEDNKEEEEPPEPKLSEVLLKVYIHCEGCEKEVKRCIQNMEGVRTVDLDMGKNLVRVKGTMDAEKLVEFIGKRGGRHAKIVKQTTVINNDDKHEEDPNGKEKEIEEVKLCYNYPVQVACCAPQLFSDENPNSCTIT